MKTYICLVEALDYGKNPNAVADLQKVLESIEGVTIKKAFYEDGTPEEGAGAGIIVQISEDDYSAANRNVRELTAKLYNVDPSFYRLGLSIINEIEK